jgi:membrane-associated phospholipid phosphatase
MNANDAPPEAAPAPSETQDFDASSSRTAVDVAATWVSGILHPLVMPLATLGLLLATDGVLEVRLGLFSYLFVLLFINTLAPAVSLAMLKRRGVISDVDIRNRAERPLPFLIVLAYYLMAYAVVAMGESVVVPLFYRQVLLALVVAIATAWVLTLRFKVSMHMMAQGGIMGVFLRVTWLQPVVDLTWASVLVLSAGLVGWSRLQLGAHTPREVYAGYAVGVASVLAVLF